MRDFLYKIDCDRSNILDSYYYDNIINFISCITDQDEINTIYVSNTIKTMFLFYNGELFNSYLNMSDELHIS